MAWMAELLGLKPRARGHIGEAAARNVASSHLQPDERAMLVKGPGLLTWNASGRAVWRFRWSHPVRGAPDLVPDLVVDIDAASGAVLRAGMPRR